jgi:hypothetical protein
VVPPGIKVKHKGCVGDPLQEPVALEPLATYPFGKSLKKWASLPLRNDDLGKFPIGSGSWKILPFRRVSMENDEK